MRIINGTPGLHVDVMKEVNLRGLDSDRWPKLIMQPPCLPLHFTLSLFSWVAVRSFFDSVALGGSVRVPLSMAA